jgi:small-conductance mechanosensitive channel
MRAYRTLKSLFIWLFTGTLAIVFVALPGYTAQNPPSLARDAVLNHLNAAITWYRDVTAKVQGVGLPSDAIYEDNARDIAAEAVRLAFQSARAEAALIDSGGKNSNASQNTANPANQQDFTQMAEKVSAQIGDVQSKLDGINKQLATASRKNRRPLLDEKQKLQGELALDQAVLDTIQKMATFVEGASSGRAEGLEGSINELARSVPEVGATSPSATKPAAKPANGAQAALANSTGLIGQALTLMGRVRGVREINQMSSETARLRQTAEDLRKPLRAEIAAAIQRGRQLADQPGGNSAAQDSAREFQDLTNRFKELSSAALPLSQEIVLLEQSSANYQEWRKSIERESREVLRALVLRVIAIAAALGILLVISEVWRRLTFRYIHETCRRRQFLLLRRFVMGFMVGTVLIMGFVSEFSSLATFAGFVTAGIAVGLQAVLLSVAAYFFVVGRYGIRVGDRISIAGVTGDVIDIGLVRLYLMELAGTGIDLYPTGRVVVFSNSVLFQTGTPLFKQIPGTEYAWHEVAVLLAPGGDHKFVQEKLGKAVDSVYQQYRERVERQLGGIEQNIGTQLKTPTTEAKLQLTDAGLEFIVRYPVDIRRASEIDDHVTRAVVDIVNNDPAVKAAAVGSPKIRAAIKG